MGIRNFNIGKTRRTIPPLVVALTLALPSLSANAQTTVPTTAPESAVALHLETVATYGTLYVIVVASVQIASRVVAAAAPASWSAAAQAFGVPLLVVPLMVEMVPMIRRNVPSLIENWVGRPPTAEQAGSTSAGNL